RIDEDLEHRLGLGQAGHPGGIELEGYEAPAATLDVAAPEIGTRRGKDEREVLPQDTVLGEVLDAIERIVDLLDLRERLRLGRVGETRIEAQLEQFDQQARDVRVRSQRGLDERLRQRKAHLPQVFRVGAQNDDLVGWESGSNDQTVEVVVLHFAPEDVP